MLFPKRKVLFARENAYGWCKIHVPHPLSLTDMLDMIQYLGTTTSSLGRPLLYAAANLGEINHHLLGRGDYYCYLGETPLPQASRSEVRPASLQLVAYVYLAMLESELFSPTIQFSSLFDTGRSVVVSQADSKFGLGVGIPRTLFRNYQPGNGVLRLCPGSRARGIAVFRNIP